MSLEVGDKIYYYSLKKDGIKISEYKIVVHKGKYNTYKRAESENKTRHLIFNDESKFGVLVHHGPGVWMKEKDEKYVRKLFLEYEEGRLNALQKELDKKKKLIEMLRKGA